jgi:hypothetical protein
MKESPILFSNEMVKAILEGRKTQTRRIAKFKPREEGLNLSFSGLETGYYCTDVPESGWVLRSRRGDGCWEDKTFSIHCPYGHPGDRLWVKETWRNQRVGPDEFEIEYKADFSEIELALYGRRGGYTPLPWKSSRFMPKSIFRILLEIADIRVERVQSISYKDARAEGMHCAFSDGYDFNIGPMGAYQANFRRLWNRLNKGRGFGWDVNPWVWVIEFKLLEVN